MTERRVNKGKKNLQVYLHLHVYVHRKLSVTYQMKIQVFKNFHAKLCEEYTSSMSVTSTSDSQPWWGHDKINLWTLI